MTLSRTEETFWTGALSMAGRDLGTEGEAFLTYGSRSNQGAENTSGWADFSGTLPEGFSGVVSSRSFLEEVGVSLFDS